MIILIFAPHPDDEILGCGGVIAKHVAAHDEVYVCISTTSLNENAKKQNEYPYKARTKNSCYKSKQKKHAVNDEHLKLTSSH